MTGRDLRAETRAALAALGDTAEQVAATLTAAGCTGQRHEAYECPVYRWLQSRGLPVESVVSNAVYLKDAPYKEIRLPGAVRCFVSRFDRGEFPGLVEAVPA